MTVFADAFFWIALLNRRDEYHPVVKDFAMGFQGRMVTTHWILSEVPMHLRVPSHDKRSGRS